MSQQVVSFYNIVSHFNVERHCVATMSLRISVLKAFALAAVILMGICNGLAPHRPSPSRQHAHGEITAAITRRSILAFSFMAATTIPPITAYALDIDAFVNQELSKDECDPRSSKKCVKKLTDDEALCKFGQPSKERGDACVRAGQSTKLTKNGVDAYGKVDRGNFTRCKQFYDLDETGKYVKKTECGLPPL